MDNSVPEGSVAGKERVRVAGYGLYAQRVGKWVGRREGGGGRTALTKWWLGSVVGALGDEEGLETVSLVNILPETPEGMDLCW